MSEKKKPSYRPCVLAAIMDDAGNFLVGQRKDSKTWQLPQGGIEPAETAEEAIFREMYEEIGSHDLEIIYRLKNPIRYDFPKNLKFSIAKSYLGQEQIWFLCKLKKGKSPDLQKATTDEFIDISWWPFEKIIDQIISWKRPSYETGFAEIKSFLIKKNKNV